MSPAAAGPITTAIQTAAASSSKASDIVTSSVAPSLAEIDTTVREAQQAVKASTAALNTQLAEAAKSGVWTANTTALKTVDAASTQSKTVTPIVTDYMVAQVREALRAALKNDDVVKMITDDYIKDALERSNWGGDVVTNAVNLILSRATESGSAAVGTTTSDLNAAINAAGGANRDTNKEVIEGLLALAGVAGVTYAGLALGIGEGAAAATGAAAASAGAATGTATGVAAATATATGIQVGISKAVAGIVGAVSVTAIVNTFNLGGWIMDSMLRPVIGALDATAPTSPAAAGVTATNIRSIMGRAMSSLFSMTIMSEMMSPLKTVGLGYLSAMMGDAAGFRPVVAGILTPYIRAAISIPMTAQVFSRLQPMVLDLSHSMKAWAMGYLTTEQFRQHIRYAGYPPVYDSYFFEEADVDLGIGQIMEAYSRGRMGDAEVLRAYKIAAGDPQWLPVLKEISYSPVREMMLRLIADSEMWDESAIREILRDRGYRPAHVDFIVGVFKLAVTSKYRSAIISSLIKTYKEGLISRDAFTREIGGTGLRADIVSMVVKQADLEYNYDYTMDQVKVIRDSYKKDLIVSEDEEYSSLLALGVSPERAETLCKIDTMTKLPKPTTPAQSAADKEAATTVKVVVSVIKAQFRKGVITYDAAVASLVSAGMSEARARATIDYEQVKMMEVPTTTAEEAAIEQQAEINKIVRSTIIAQFRKELITAEDAIAGLVSAGMSEAEALATIGYEAVKMMPKAG